MTVKLPIKSLSARLRLIAVHALQGQVVYDDLHWQLVSVSPDLPKKTHVSMDAMPVFDVLPGEYRVVVSYEDRDVDAGVIDLQRAQLREFVVYVGALSDMGREEDHFVDSAEVDKLSEFTRREHERAGQPGDALGPLADPYQQPAGDQGVSFQSHPLLQNAQNDGMPPDLKVEPSENNMAVSNELQKQHQKQMEKGAAPAMSTPRPGLL